MILLMIYFFIIALYNPNIGNLNLSNYFLLFWFFIFLIFKNTKLKIYNFKRINVMLIFVVFLYLLITLIFSTDKINSIILLLKLTVPYILSILLLNIINTKEKFNIFINILVCSGAFASLYGCIQYFFGLSDYVLQSIGGIVVYRAVGAFNLPNVFASFLVLIIPFMFYKIKVTQNKFIKLINIISLIITLTCLYLTYSRWAIICLVIAFSIYLIRRILHQIIHKRIRLNKKILLISPMILGVVIFLINKYFNDIYVLFFNRESNDIRKSSIMYAIEKFNENIWGYGLGNGNNGIILDSTYVNLLLDTGLIGLILFSVLLFTVYVGFKRSSNSNISLGNIYNIASISLLIFILNGVLETVLYNTMINIFLGIYLFILNADKKIVTQPKNISTKANIELKKKRRYKLAW